MSVHYGPSWAWDQTRPEAIEARAQMAKFRTQDGTPGQTKSGSPKLRGIWLRQLAVFR